LSTSANSDPSLSYLRNWNGGNRSLLFLPQVHKVTTLHTLTCSLSGQFFHGGHPLVGLSFAEVSAGYLLRCRCMAWVMFTEWRVYSSVALSDALIEHGLTSPPTQYRLYGQRFGQKTQPTVSKDW